MRCPLSASYTSPPRCAGCCCYAPMQAQQHLVDTLSGQRVGYSTSALFFSFCTRAGTHEPSTTKRIASSQPRGLFFFARARGRPPSPRAPVINSVMRAFRRPLSVFLAPLSSPPLSLSSLACPPIRRTTPRASARALFFVPLQRNETFFGNYSSPTPRRAQPLYTVRV